MTFVSGPGSAQVTLYSPALIVDEPTVTDWSNLTVADFSEAANTAIWKMSRTVNDNATFFIDSPSPPALAGANDCIEAARRLVQTLVFLILNHARTGGTVAARQPVNRGEKFDHDEQSGVRVAGRNHAAVNLHGPLCNG
jgi:hypothetical protein